MSLVLTYEEPFLWQITVITKLFTSFTIKAKSLAVIFIYRIHKLVPRYHCNNVYINPYILYFLFSVASKETVLFGQFFNPSFEKSLWTGSFYLEKAAYSTEKKWEAANDKFVQYILADFFTILKGQCHEIFCFRFFSWISFPQDPEGRFEFFRIFSQICHRCQRHRRQNCRRYQRHRQTKRLISGCRYLNPLPGGSRSNRA